MMVYLLGLYRDSGKEIGNDYSRVLLEVHHQQNAKCTAEAVFEMYWFPKKGGYQFGVSYKNDYSAGVRVGVPVIRGSTMCML